MLTASGSIKKWALFGEAVYQYGSDREWLEKQSFDDKKSVFKATAGFMRSWEDPNISLLAQYYYDGNDFDASTLKDCMFYLNNMNLVMSEYGTKGHNVALSLGFSKLFGNKDLSLSIFGLANFTKPGLIDPNDPSISMMAAILESQQTGAGDEFQAGINDAIEMLKASPRGIFSVALNYNFNKNASMSFGPYITVADWKKAPMVAMKIDFSLGGGKF